MRRYLLLIAAMLLVSMGWSQSVTLNFKDGTTQKFSMSEITSIDFADDGSESKTYDVLEINGEEYIRGYVPLIYNLKFQIGISRHLGLF